MENVEIIPKNNITDLQIKQAIRKCFEVNNEWIANDQLVMVLYKMLCAVILKDVKYVFLQAPTGSGKSIVGFAFSWCFNLLKDNDNSNNNPENQNDEDEAIQTYFLTSSKALQSQLQGDIDRFNLNDVKMLKGGVNYECTRLTADTGEYHNYKERWCKNMKGFEVQALSCYDTCPYLNARSDASRAGVSILNYWYFLSAVRKMRKVKDADGKDTDEDEEDQRKPLFGVRPLTICDEAHLISDIVIGMYNLTLTVDAVILLRTKMQNMQKNYGKYIAGGRFDVMEALINQIYVIFTRSKIGIKDVYDYEENINKVRNIYADIKAELGDRMQNTDEVIDEDENNKGCSNSDYLQSLSTRPDDLFIESTFHGKFGEHVVYKHNVYDMNESMITRKYFLSRTETTLFMSATFGKFSEFAYLMGIAKTDYVGFEMSNTFDFSQSPIYLQMSGYLNHKSFERNIRKVLTDTIFIAESMDNRNLKGIIHTSTFNISNMLKEMIESGAIHVQNKERYLFYTNSKEKEELLHKMKYLSGNFLITGPSLYEGLDLKDHLGRLNFLVKVPYSGIGTYTKEKMERYPFWYQRTTVSKIEQSIGRTNRHKADWSKTYLMDSCFSDIVFETDEHIIKRLKQGKK